MKKNLFRFLVVALAAASMASFTVTGAFAENTVYPKDDNDTVVTTWTEDNSAAANTLTDITVKGFEGSEEELEVIAYQIVKGTYKDGKLTGYVLCDRDYASLDNMEIPTEEEIAAIANNIGNNLTTLNGIKMTSSRDKKSYTAKVEAGEYIVLVRGSNAVIYNPAVVSVNVTDANLLATKTTEVDMTGFFKIGNTQAYIKSSSPTINKTIVSSSKNNPEGDTVAYGDTVKFKLDNMTIPSYSQDYEDGTIVYKITDTLDDNAFKGVTVPIVKVGGNEIAPTPVAEEGKTVEDNDKTYTLTYKNTDGITCEADEATSFVIEFDDYYIRSLRNKSPKDRAVEVTYSTKFIDGADVNYAEHKNTAELEYSNNPTDSTKTNTVNDTTYHYTFGIDASIDAQDDDGGNYETHELNKVTEAAKNGEDDYVDGKNDKGVDTKKSKKPLGNAIFTLYSDSDFASEHQIATSTSDENGHISFKGLDEGKYYLKETKAPDDYTLNSNDYEIIISATLDGKGIMTSYSIDTYLLKYDDEGKLTIGDDGSITSKEKVGSATYENAYEVQDDDYVKNIIKDSVVPAEVVDTKLAELPSTGGAGTIALTIGASLGMAAFLTVYIVNKKKKVD